ncbi:outer membrane beta-barrel protein [Colwellia sp. C1TZA3]|uniref:outer membrane beta-barrel protein n=1 Tax=Colwellia sp. C1TZA3 TaxID=2508879 RepID=UPI0011B9FD21|nr:porin family protein [Colwellia sp. C1TZA3]TWX72819.1 porin family protein [Colwellia sp. C1TZA3]
MKVNSQLTPRAILCTFLLSNVAIAQPLELSVMVGQIYGPDLVTSDNSDIDIDSGSNIAVGIAWQENVNGQGQILFNRVSHDFIGQNQVNNELDITYAHFNGVALYRQQSYVTTLSLGLGGAYFDAEQGSEELYPSASVAFGTRYEFSQQIALVTELRAYATLIDEDDAMFCQRNICNANFSDSLWIDSSIALGIAIKF